MTIPGNYFVPSAGSTVGGFSRTTANANLSIDAQSAQSIGSSLSEFPSLARLATNDAEIAGILSNNPKVLDRTASLLHGRQDFAKVLGDNPDLARTMLTVLRDYPGFGVMFAKEPKLLTTLSDIAAKDPSLGTEVMRFLLTHPKISSGLSSDAIVTGMLLGVAKWNPKLAKDMLEKM